VSGQEVEIPSAELNLIEDEAWSDLLTGEAVRPGEDAVTLAPYQCRWITNFR